MSGTLLHQRGYRSEAGAAPLRETLAAAILRLARWRPDAEALVDPMCGAGTLVLEAALQALRIPPGRKRGFAFQSWTNYEPARWRELLDEADAARLAAPPCPLRGADADPAVIELARRNAERAGLGDHVTFEAAALATSTPPAAPSGLVVVNPPYGRRLEAPARARRLYTELGNVLAARYPGWRAAVLCPNRKTAAALNLLVGAYHPLSSGGRHVDLVLASI